MPVEHIDALIHANLSPLVEISEPKRRRLLEVAAHVDALVPGDKLNASDWKEWFLYLLEGRVALVSRGVAENIKSAEPRALTPLFGERLAGEFVVAESPCKVLKVDRRACNALLNQERTAGFKVQDVEANLEETRIFEAVLKAARAKRLDLPSMPEVAVRIQQMTQDDEVGIRELVQVIQMDPAIAGALIHATNSPLYRGTKKIDNIRDAVLRIGLNTTRKLASNIALRHCFKTSSATVRERMHTLWTQSINVSSICFVLARRIPGFEPERALLAGLIHQIGVIPILNYIAKHEANLEAAVLEKTIHKLHLMTGVMVANYWGLDAELVAVVEQSHDWQRDKDTPPDYCDLVIIARLLNLQESEHATPLPRPDEIPAFQKFNLGMMDENCNLRLLKEAEHELNAIKQVLNV